MRLTYDPKGDLLYIRLRSAARHDREELDDGVSVDYDAEGHVIGFEMTQARRRLTLEELTSVAYENIGSKKRASLTLP